MVERASENFKSLDWLNIKINKSHIINEILQLGGWKCDGTVGKSTISFN